MSCSARCAPSRRIRWVFGGHPDQAGPRERQSGPPRRGAQGGRLDCFSMRYDANVHCQVPQRPAVRSALTPFPWDWAPGQPLSRPGRSLCQLCDVYTAGAVFAPAVSRRARARGPCSRALLGEARRAAGPVANDPSHKQALGAYRLPSPRLSTRGFRGACDAQRDANARAARRALSVSAPPVASAGLFRLSREEPDVGVHPLRRLHLPRVRGRAPVSGHARVLRSIHDARHLEPGPAQDHVRGRQPASPGVLQAARMGDGRATALLLAPELWAAPEAPRSHVPSGRDGRGQDRAQVHVPGGAAVPRGLGQGRGPVPDQWLPLSADHP